MIAKLDKKNNPPKKSKKVTKTKAQKTLEKLDYININAAGIDIGSKSHFVAIPAGRDTEHVREFRTFTNDLIDLVNWLKKCGIKTVAMESTGVYWIPVYDMLEENGFEVLLVNARHIKNVPGRKTDVLDCQWIQQLHSYGLLRGSFRPKDKILEMRTIMRHREMLIDFSASHIQRMQKCLFLMNIQLKNVIRDITGATGMNIIRAIVEGERDPGKLAKFRDPNCKNSEEIIKNSLIGNYQAEHIFCLKQALEMFDTYSQKIDECNQLIEKIIGALEAQSGNNENKEETEKSVVSRKKRATKKHGYHFDMHQELFRIAGVDLTAIPGTNVQTIARVIAEIGVDMSKWETSKQFAAWLGLCPGNKVSGGKKLSGKTAPNANRAAAAFRMGASTLYGDQSALGGYYRRMRSRLGSPKAITAAAHKMAVILYNMLKTGSKYMDSGAEYYEEMYRERCVKNLHRKAHVLGYTLVPIAAEAIA